MKDSEIFTLALELLKSGDERTTKEIAEHITNVSGQRVSEIEVFDALVKFEAAQKVRRSNRKNFDEYKPVTTSSWIILDQGNITEERSTLKLYDYVNSAMAVVSQPIFLSRQGLEFKNLGMPILSVGEAMEKIVLDAKEEIRIACPYYDDLFIEILSKNTKNIQHLKHLSILAERADPILLKARKLFPNTKLKTLYGSTLSGHDRELKVQGLHAKVMIADQSQVLIGSFNFRYSHLHYNVDMGILLKGKIAEHYARIFDSIWEVNL
jgi:hypothetical protein